MKRESIPKKTRELVKAKYNGHCAYCGEKPEKLVIDHLHAVARHISFERKHGELDINDISNLMPACFSCNNYKTTYSLEEFRRELSKQVERARENSINFRLAERFGQIIIKNTPIRFYFEELEAYEMAYRGETEE